MKKLILLMMVAMLSYTLSFSQKVGYVDTEYILGKIPAYQDAQKRLEELSQAWQKEIEAIYTDVENKYKKYQEEKVLLPEETRNKREEEIIAREKTAKDLQKKYFGREGELYQKRQELVKPIQDNVYNALKEVASSGNFDIIFDKVTGDIIYTNDRYDESDAVLKKMGY